MRRNNLSAREVMWNFHEDILFVPWNPLGGCNDGQIRSGMHSNIDWN